jgi:hypothetical protein
VGGVVAQLGGVVAQWLERQTMDARVPGSNPGISQGWDYWKSPLLGGQNKGLLRNNLDGIYVETCLASSWWLGRSRRV